ncbi:hypothetical protein LguiA_018675 [Lonicera macranthoides]
MERKRGLFFALKGEAIQGLSPSRSCAKSSAQSASPMSGLLRWRKISPSANSEDLISRSESMMLLGETLTTLMEGPNPDGGEVGTKSVLAP